ncbi:unnamed protein product, partial [Gulo gulo]
LLLFLAPLAKALRSLQTGLFKREKERKSKVISALHQPFRRLDVGFERNGAKLHFYIWETSEIKGNRCLQPKRHLDTEWRWRRGSSGPGAPPGSLVGRTCFTPGLHTSRKRD